MTNELVPIDETLGRFAAMERLADKICRTNFVPADFRGKPAEALAAILAGQELGLGPMASLRSIHVIDGRPTMAAELQLAMVRKAGHRVVPQETTAERCVLRGWRREDPDDLYHEVEWTIQDARSIVVSRDGKTLADKDSWKNYPRAMLWARAVTTLVTQWFPEVTLGISYTPDELDPSIEQVPAEIEVATGEVIEVATGEVVEGSGGVGEKRIAEPDAFAWAMAAKHLAIYPDSRSVMDDIEVYVRRLFDLMGPNGLNIWPDRVDGVDALHAALELRQKKHLRGEEGFTKQPLVAFCQEAVIAARAALEAAWPRDTALPWQEEESEKSAADEELPLEKGNEDEQEDRTDPEPAGSE